MSATSDALREELQNALDEAGLSKVDPKIMSQCKLKGGII
jgi:hypothetical protein